MLQGYADDSGSEGQGAPYFLAGFVMQAEQWARFADAWKEQLDRPPRIEYFKMFEAASGKGQFGGREFYRKEIRARKICDLLEILEAFKPVGLYSSVDWREFRTQQKPFVSGGATDPYHCLVPWLFDVLMAWQQHQEIFPEPVNFDFDEQGIEIGKAILSVYPIVKHNVPESLRKMLGRIPEMLDDKLYNPLQAADMLAWNLRHHHDPVRNEDEWEWLYERLNALCFSGAFGPGSYEGLQMFNAWQNELQRRG